MVISEDRLPRIDVLLATYNGADYLREQIDSVLAQQGVEVCLRIRDDGSSDATFSILQDYARRYPGHIDILMSDEERRGAAHSFLRLLAAPSCSDYFALCDQDDVWQVDKLQVAVSALESMSGPLRLYCSAVEFVDQSLQPLGSSTRRVTPSFQNALVENIAQGCTMVGDSALRESIVRNTPRVVAMHDWWLYLVAAAFGCVAYDPVPRLLYRQHHANAVGGAVTLRKKLLKNWIRYSSGRAWPMAAQAAELLRLYPAQLTETQREVLQLFLAGKLNWFVRLRLVLNLRIRRQSLLETLAVKFLVLINAY